MLKLTPGINQAVAGLAEEVRPVPLANPILLGWSEQMASTLGLRECSESVLRQLNGEGPFALAPTAQVYSGHQFGGYTPRLGDGRGCHLGELNGWELFLKGSGPTPYSRGGDGRAVIRSAVREFLASEALHHLGISTSRALAVLASDTPVFREQPERGAITVRVTPSHLRFGHFEYFRHSQQPKPLQALLDYALTRYFPQCQQQSDPVAALFLEVTGRTADTIADWQAAGFAHGVLNSDNMSLLGETFDYGPFAFMDRCDPGFVCNHSDHYGRYAFDQQPGIGWWNLQRLALALSDHLDSEVMPQALELYQSRLTARYLWRMEARLGLGGEGDLQARLDRVSALVGMMQRTGVDYHTTLRLFARLNPQGEGGELQVRLGADDAWLQWWQQYQQALSFGKLDAWQQARAGANPAVVLRTHLAQAAIEAAERDDAGPLMDLHRALCHPYDDHPETPHYTEDPPSWASSITLSCSS
ncbi:protein adenylyltransferase SelO [Ferrimonas sp.]|uniref:protein adenylyltransferase SelO n=1 Tax=Ferrimonas sp. TaxID=2080861 RepID=UPI003A932194